MKISLPSHKNFPLFNLDKLTKNLELNISKLKNGSDSRPNTFRKDIELFNSRWLELEDPIFLLDSQLRSIIIYLLESEKTFDRLVSVDLLEDFVYAIEASKDISNHKRLVQLYFQYYQKILTIDFPIEKEIRELLSNFTGRNMLMKQYHENIELLVSPDKLIEQYTDVEVIQREMNFSTNSEYYQTLLILGIVKQVDTLYPGEHRIDLFKQIAHHKDYNYKDGLKISEYAVRTMIESMMFENTTQDYSEWINFIMDMLGDPRTVSLQTAHNVQWNRVGEKYKDFLIGYLSREDLGLFLETLSSPEHDDIYKYRKAFWKPFAKYVRFTKLFITKHEYMQLSDNMRRRFSLSNNSAYSFISDRERSCIYIDLGEIKIIEGTHNVMVRLYSDVPISLNKRQYDYTDFYNPAKASNAMVFYTAHQGSEKGSWQNKVLKAIKQYKNVDITLRETLYS